jgi:hypothetical protein
MKKKDSLPIGKILTDFFENNPQIANKLAETRLINYWNNMNPAISRYTSNLFIKNRVLYVKLQSSVLKNELMMLREQLMINLNREAGKSVIDNIIFI